jgi:hypothetical protein
MQKSASGDQTDICVAHLFSDGLGVFRSIIFSSCGEGTEQQQRQSRRDGGSGSKTVAFAGRKVVHLYCRSQGALVISGLTFQIRRFRRKKSAATKLFPVPNRGGENVTAHVPPRRSVVQVEFTKTELASWIDTRGAARKCV